MVIRKPPSINTVRTLKYDLVQKKPQSDTIVFRSAFGTAIPVSKKTGFYQFKSSANGAICFEISDLISDYGSFTSRSQAITFANTFKQYAKLWLEKRGYSPVTFRVVSQWNTGYGYNDPQLEIRTKIWQDFLDVRNFGRQLSDYEGIRPVQKSFIPDNGSKY
jgi:hypothetical protein